MKSRPALPVRVLVPGLQWPPETFLAQLFRGLAARGIEMTLVATAAPDAGWRNVPNLEIMVAPGWSGPLPARLARFGGRLGGALARSSRETRRLFKCAGAAEGSERPIERLYYWLPFAGRRWDVVYFPWNSAAIAYLPLMDKLPAVVSCRGAQVNIAPLNPQRAHLRRGLGETFARAAAVHCVSEAIRHEAAHYGLDITKAVIIRPAVDAEAFRPAERPRDPSTPFRVITTGANMWRKGLEYALLSVRRLRERGVPVQFDIIGDGPESQRLIYTMHDLGLADCVARHGRLTPSEVAARLVAADVFLLSSLSEGIANAALEGMACGLPLVTTDVGGMAEAVTDGVEGFLVPPRDSESMAAALERLYADPERRRRMGAAARRRIETDFNLRDQIDAFAALFGSLVQT
jgi:colanic acid/amylovoran biosynthesis glycosyltransferase